VVVKRGPTAQLMPNLPDLPICDLCSVRKSAGGYWTTADATHNEEQQAVSHVVLSTKVQQLFDALGRPVELMLSQEAISPVQSRA
jgi:hypothetical protein